MGDGVDTARLMCLWGKTSRTNGAYHPALFHMLDVAHVATALLSTRASPRWRLRLADTLGADAAGLRHWLPWVLGLHDIGKVSVPFQIKDEAQRDRLGSLGFDFGGWRQQDNAHHTVVGQVCASGAGAAVLGLPEDRLGRAICVMIGGHHGAFCDAEKLVDVGAALRHREPADWAALRRATADALRMALDARLPAAPPSPANVSAAAMLLCGFTILCDWLGSDETYFSAEPDMELASYVDASRKRAEAAVRTAGLWSPVRSDAGVTFHELFPELRPVRPLQAAIDSIPSALLSQPCLVVLEAPTGEGKTEAALALAHRLAQEQGTDEMYYALPTTATSNQMFTRVQHHLRDRLGLGAQVKLVHGQAFLVEDDLRLEPLKGDADADAASLEWFGPRKKALLAPFGVGTIDQTELGALNVRHNALRLAGLAGKVVILDEVHAYDAYMTTVVERLLRWLAATRTSVILLSATLPQAQRRVLAQAYAGKQGADAPVSYPGLWVVGAAGKYSDAPPAYQPERSIELSWLQVSDDDAHEKARWLASAVADGGCACWITNTVERAQRLYEAVAGMAGDADLMLLHARFPLAKRQELEERLATLYGPRGSRPARGIVIGTQVLEQSLDLDFDVMVSDLAPVDLLLQRSGRLHRHRQHDACRPPQHARARLWVNRLLGDDGLLLSRADCAVYDEYILRRSWGVLDGRTEIVLPRDYRTLVEHVYSESPPATGSPLSASWDALLRKRAIAQGEAWLRLMPEPDPDGLACQPLQPLQYVEDEFGVQWITAKTRLGEESVGVIALERRGEKALLPGSERWLDINQAASREDQLTLLRHGLRVSQQTVASALKDSRRNRPALFGESPLLRDHAPLWLREGQCELDTGRGPLLLRLDERLGLVIRRKGG